MRTLTRHARRTLVWTVPTGAAAVAVGVLALTGVLTPHHSASRPKPSASASPAVLPATTQPPTPSPTVTVPTSPSAQSAAPTVPARSAAPADLDLHSVDWNDVAVPGDTCFSNAPIQLHKGQAIIPGTPHDRSVTLGQLWNPSNTKYGRLGDSSADDAALVMDCAYAYGTAASILQLSVVVFSGAGGTLHALGTLRPTVHLQGMHATGITDVAVADGQVSFTEIFYGPYDIDANGTGGATTVYTWTGSGFTSHTTITRQPATTPPTFGR